MRMIDADALKEFIGNIRAEFDFFTDEERPHYEIHSKAIEALNLYLEDAPTIEIVRCKECKFNYANEHNCEYNPEDIVCTYWASDGLRVDDFCSYGARMTERSE